MRELKDTSLSGTAGNGSNIGKIMKIIKGG